MKLVLGTGVIVSGVEDVVESFVPQIEGNLGADSAELSITIDVETTTFTELIDAIRADGALDTLAVNSNLDILIESFVGYTTLSRIQRLVGAETITFRVTKELT